MATITENQRRSYLAQATDAARTLAEHLRNLSPGEQAAILAIVANKAGTPVDIAMIGEPHDWLDARGAITKELRCDPTGRWELGSGCHLQIVELPR